MRLSFAWMVLVSCFFLCAGARARESGSYLYPGSSGKWCRYTSPHFELLSQAKEKDSRALLHKLELLRALFFDQVKLVERQPTQVTIYYFDRPADYLAYVPEQLRISQSAAVYQRDPDRAVMLLAAGLATEEVQTILFRAYIYHLFQEIEMYPMPWYFYGLAEFFCTVEIVGDKLQVGRANGKMLRELRATSMPPLDRLFFIPDPLDAGKVAARAVDDGRSIRAPSWAFIHYCNVGDSQIGSEQVADFEAYSRSVRERFDPAAARRKFQEIFKRDYASMQQALDGYVQRGSYKMFQIPQPKIDASATYSRVELNQTQAIECLAELSFRTTRSPTGKQVLLAAATGAPPRTRALEVLGTDATRDGDVRSASERWEQAIAAGSTNPAIFRELARIATARWFQRFDYYFRLPPAELERLRALLRRSIENAPNQIAAYALMAWVEASANEPSRANLKLIQEHFQSLGDERQSTMLALALICVRLHHEKEADELLTRLEVANPPERLRDCIKIVRTQLATSKETNN